MRLSRRVTGVLLVLAFAGVLAPGALAGQRKPPPPQPVAVTPVVVVAPEPAYVSMVDIEALK
jgi:hypothetical protein